MKKILPLFMVILFTGCSSASISISTDNSTEETTASAQTSSSKDMQSSETNTLTSLFNDIKQQTSLGETIQVSENNILNRYGIDSADLDDYIFEEPATGENVDTLIIAKCKTEDTVSQVKDALEAQLENAKATTENYSPEQYALYNKSIIATNKNYVYWIVSESPEEIADIINSSIEWKNQ